MLDGLLRHFPGGFCGGYPDLFSGFGLGTILTPVFMIFFPTEVAIALTGVVHFCNNIFKIFLVGRHANREVLLRFGIPAVIAAFIGAWLLLQIPDQQPLFSHNMFARTVDVYPVKFIVSVLLLSFASIEFLPYFKNLQFGKDKLPIGGAISGFFGGLSGNQGALRSAFLIRAGLSKEAFIGTAVVVSTFVDFTRLSVYATRFSRSGLAENILLVACATLAAIAGAYLGNKLLKKSDPAVCAGGRGHHAYRPVAGPGLRVDLNREEVTCGICSMDICGTFKPWPATHN